MLENEMIRFIALTLFSFLLVSGLFIFSAQASASDSQENLESVNIPQHELETCLQRLENSTLGAKRLETEKTACHCMSAFLEKNLADLETINHMTIGQLKKASVPTCRCLIKSPNADCSHPKISRGYKLPEDF